MFAGVSAPITSLSIDLGAALRRRKPHKWTRQLTPRGDSELTTAADLSTIGPIALLADTNVYINDAAGSLPAVVVALLDRTTLFHCAVCTAEIATGVANGDPSHAHWQTARDAYAEVLSAIPETRLLTPDAGVWLDAGLIAGTLARTQRCQPHQRKELLNDALILLTAAKAGLAVLTADRVHYDLLQQLCPEASFVYY